MILRAHYERIGKACHSICLEMASGWLMWPTALGGAIYVSRGTSADLQQALDDFFATKRARAARLKNFKKAALPGVKV